MKKNKIALRNIIGGVIGFGIVAIAQSQMGWTDGSWDLLKIWWSCTDGRITRVGIR